MEANIEITWEMVLGFAAALVTFSKAFDVLLRLTKPQKEMKSRMERVERYLENDTKRQSKAAMLHTTILETLVLVLDHMIDGNNIEKMKMTRLNLQGKIVDMSAGESNIDEF